MAQGHGTEIRMQGPQTRLKRPSTFALMDVGTIHRSCSQLTEQRSRGLELETRLSFRAAACCMSRRVGMEPIGARTKRGMATLASSLGRGFWLAGVAVSAVVAAARPLLRVGVPLVAAALLGFHRCCLRLARMLLPELGSFAAVDLSDDEEEAEDDPPKGPRQRRKGAPWPRAPPQPPSWSVLPVVSNVTLSGACWLLVAVVWAEMPTTNAHTGGYGARTRTFGRRQRACAGRGAREVPAAANER